jgi:hypothetical protein
MLNELMPQVLPLSITPDPASIKVYLDGPPPDQVGPGQTPGVQVLTTNPNGSWNWMYDPVNNWVFINPATLSVSASDTLYVEYTSPQSCPVGEVCATLGGLQRCLTPCDPYAQNCPILDAGPEGGPVVSGCYYEPAVAMLVCEPEGLGAESTPCSSNSDCAPGSDCFPLSAGEVDAGLVQACRYFCDTGSGVCPVSDSDGGIDDGGGPYFQCVPVAAIEIDGGTNWIGACQPY